MIKKIVFGFCFVVIFVFLNTYKVYSNSLTNEERYFLRLSEKYLIEEYKNWEKTISIREQIIKELKSTDRYKEYKEYLRKTKNNDLYRTKSKYIKRLNYYIENNQDKKIKRYLKLVLNIFDKENELLISEFDISFSQDLSN